MRIGIIGGGLKAIRGKLADVINRYQEKRVLKKTGRMLQDLAAHNPKVRRLVRGGIMRTGAPILKGARLARAQKSCCPANLLVQPKRRKYEDGLCNCGQHIRLASDILGELRSNLSRALADKLDAEITGRPYLVGLDLATKADIGLPRPALTLKEILTDAGYVTG